MTSQDFAIPTDKHSRPMRLLAATDISKVAENLQAAQRSKLPERGSISVFIAEDIDKYQPKDKNGFRVVWHSSSIPVPDMTPSIGSTAPRTAAKLPVDFQISDSPIPTGSHPRLDEAKAICAFSANGITYSDTRARDDCYAHLIAQVPNWNLILQCSDGGTDYLLLIHNNDVDAEHFDKAWLVRFKGNS
jgi:hypothetical protein